MDLIVEGDGGSKSYRRSEDIFASSNETHSLEPLDAQHNKSADRRGTVEAAKQESITSAYSIRRAVVVCNDKSTNKHDSQTFFHSRLEYQQQ